MDKDSKSQQKPDFKVALNASSSVKKVIGIVSGKGGVGKSLVTSLLASAFRKNGHNVAILDADITGPSIPKAFGIKGNAVVKEEGIEPRVSKTGIKLMSVNFLLSYETEPIIWRGPLIAGAVKQFWSEVMWGDVDYMFIDMPPGTGDVPLTVFQSLKVDGIIIVSSPQELVSMIVSKAVNMAKAMNIPILGLIENMSYFVCPNCTKKHNIFGASGIEKIAQKYDLKVLAKIPIDPAISVACDKGEVEDIDSQWLTPAVYSIESSLEKNNSEK
ncbi:MAG TPA: Mrp/NBP35 family ATP-binding protein [Clostridia bacterium]